MKTLRLAFSRIITYFLENKIIFVLYFIGTVASVFMMIFYYGNTLTFKTGVNDNVITYRLFTIDFVESQKVTAETLEKLKSFEQDYDIQDIILYSVLDKNGNDTRNPEYTVEYSPEGVKYFSYYGGDDNLRPTAYLTGDIPHEGRVTVVESYLYNNNDVMYNPKSNIFTDKQLKQNVAIAPRGKTENIKIQGQEFKTIRNESVSDYVIPIEKYFDSNIRTCRIKICVSERFSKDSLSLYDKFLDDWLKELYPDADFEIKTPDAYYLSEDFDNIIYGYATIVAVFAVALISFMFLLKYLMDSCRRENSILMMVGAKRKRIILINLLENIILTLSSSAVAVVLHIALYDSLVTKINLYKNITYSAQDYLIIVLLAIGLSLIVQIPFIFTYWFKNIRNIKEG